MRTHSTIAKDPWTWTADDLVANVCNSTSLFYVSGCRPDDLPNSAALKAQLLTQEVSGATFLTALNSDTLRGDLGIQNLGQRQALMSVVEHLRRQSIGYRQHTANAGIQALDISYKSVPHETQAGNLSSSTAPQGTSGRKRQKITHISTTPHSLSRQGPPLISTIPYQSMEQSTIDGSGAWDHLLRWEQEGQHIVAIEDIAAGTDDESEDGDEELDGRSGSGEPDNMLAEEFGDRGQNRLSQDKIVDIINECIEHYTTAWKPNHGVLKGDEIDYDPDFLWQEAESSNQRQRFIETYTSEAAYYRNRLDRLCDEILKSPGNTSERIRYQCRNLEVTINSVELAEWLLSIYSLNPVDSEVENEEEVEMPSQLSHQPGVVQMSSTPELPVHHATTPPAQPSLNVVDLGSPPESSQSDVDDLLAYGLLRSEVSTRNSMSSLKVPRIADPIAESVESSAGLFVRVPTATPVSPQVHGTLNDVPQNASLASVKRWTWSNLVDARDRKRIVTKALYEMETIDREMIRHRVKTVGKAEMNREIAACTDMLARRETKIPGVLPRDLQKIIIVTRLFLCWWLCNDYFQAEPTIRHLDQLHEHLQEGLADIGTFCDYLSTVVATTFNPEALRNPDRPSQAEIIEISDDDGNEDNEAPLQLYRTQPQSGISQRSMPIVLE